ncbi:hypothetical protein ILYODFUR_029941 [Ilyodon furcidens]|uniref:Uncharacterized protein n=1 Tax=Ilyodon furcidens TaxID=33524 RepID=A0ABV0UP75_9TELE
MGHPAKESISSIASFRELMVLVLFSKGCWMRGFRKDKYFSILKGVQSVSENLTLKNVKCASLHPLPAQNHSKDFKWPECRSLDTAALNNSGKMNLAINL